MTTQTMQEALEDCQPPYNVEAFAWRDRTGQWHLVKRMETRHLFYTLRMIWNHTMPSSTRLPGNLYSFGPTYTRQYMIAAIKAIVPELEQRKDMTPDWTAQLTRMKGWLLTPQLPNLEAHKAHAEAAEAAEAYDKLKENT